MVKKELTDLEKIHLKPPGYNIIGPRIEKIQEEIQILKEKEKEIREKRQEKERQLRPHLVYKMLIGEL